MDIIFGVIAASRKVTVARLGLIHEKRMVMKCKSYSTSIMQH